MKIQELENKHYSIFEDRGIGNPNIKHTDLSIQFAIEVLNDMIGNSDIGGYINENFLKSEIQELKQYLDEK